MSHNKLINIAVTEQNYLRLKSLGGAGDSFNDVVTKLLLKTIGGKKINTVSLGSDMGFMGDVEEHHKPIISLAQPKTNDI